MDAPLTLEQIVNGLNEAQTRHDFKKSPYSRITGSDLSATVNPDGSVTLVLYESGFEPGAPGERVYRIKMTMEVEERKVDD